VSLFSSPCPRPGFILAGLYARCGPLRIARVFNAWPSRSFGCGGAFQPVDGVEDWPTPWESEAMDGIRALRRAHDQRMKARARTVMKRWYGRRPVSTDPREIGRNASTHCRPCGCWSASMTSAKYRRRARGPFTISNLHDNCELRRRYFSCEIFFWAFSAGATYLLISYSSPQSAASSICRQEARQQSQERPQPRCDPRPPAERSLREAPWQ